MGGGSLQLLCLNPTTDLVVMMLGLLYVRCSVKTLNAEVGPSPRQIPDLTYLRSSSNILQTASRSLEPVADGARVKIVNCNQCDILVNDDNSNQISLKTKF